MTETLLYMTIGLYVLAVILHFLLTSEVGFAFFLAGSTVNLYLWVRRWIDAGHIPFSNMYELFLSLGACMIILHLITEYGLKTKAPWLDPLLAAVILTGGSFRDPDIAPLMPALQSPLFFPHVFSYLVAYVAMGKSFGLALLTLSGSPPLRPAYERSTYHVIRVGFPLLTLGLLLGAVWGKLAWGDYWSWDPKEMWSLITWMTYLAYFHFRYRKGPRHWAVPWLAVLGFVMVVLTLLWVNLAKVFSDGMHSYA